MRVSVRRLGFTLSGHDTVNEAFRARIEIGCEVEKRRQVTGTVGNTDPLQAEDSDQATAEPALSNFLQRQLDRCAESAEAFNQDATEEPSMRDLLEEHVKWLR